MKGPDIRRAVAEEGDGDPAIAAQLGRHAGTDGDRQPRAHNGKAADQVEVLVGQMHRSAQPPGDAGLLAH